MSWQICWFSDRKILLILSPCGVLLAKLLVTNSFRRRRYLVKSNIFGPRVVD